MRVLTFTASAAASMFVLLIGQTIASGQAFSPAAKVGAGKTWTPPRTADGRPDLSGSWNDRVATPLERPKDLGSKEFYTDEEFAALSARLRSGDPNVPRPRGFGGDGAAAAGGVNAVNVQYDHGLFGYDVSKSGYASTKRTSLIVGPEGVIPPMLPAARERNAARIAKNRGHEFDSYENINLETRCILSNLQMIPMIPTEETNTHIQIVQGAGYVAIYQELNHDTRVIPTDGRPHIASNIRQLQGDSVGHWEGATLVVDTTNFTGRTYFRGSSENLHLIERFTRTADDTLIYSFTVEDPATWAKPWTAEIPWHKNNGPLYEYACTEGNDSMSIILSGARAKEAEAAKNAAK